MIHSIMQTRYATNLFFNGASSGFLESCVPNWHIRPGCSNNATCLINLYLVDSVKGFVITYPLDNDLSVG